MQPIEHNYSEKRDFIRMKLDTPVTIRCEGRESVALCRDLSASGLLLEAQSELAPGDLRVSIPSTHETLTGLELARVVRCERSAGSAPGAEHRRDPLETTKGDPRAAFPGCRTKR